MGKGKRKSTKTARKPKSDTNNIKEGTDLDVSEEEIVVSRDCINCDACGIASPQMCCARCHSFYYCSKECQVAHWNKHKPFCTSLKLQREKLEAAHDLSGKPPGVIEGPCVICLEDFVTNPVTLGCGHVFCFRCLGAYQDRSRDSSHEALCPYCRGKMPNLLLKAMERAQIYHSRAKNLAEGSVERKQYAQLAIVECDAICQLGADNGHYGRLHSLFLKAMVHATLLNEPEATLEIADKILSESKRGKERKMNEDDLFKLKIWRADSFSKMGEWAKACEIYLALTHSPYSQQARHQIDIAMGMCRCYFELGHYNMAIKVGTATVFNFRHHPGVHKFLALAQKAICGIDAAKRTMSRAILYEERWNHLNLQHNKQVLRDLSNH